MGKKGQSVWVWLAMDLETRRIVAVHFGTRQGPDAQAFVNKIPLIYRKHACIDTDRHRSYEKPLWRCNHTRWRKGDGMTSHLERFNLTLRTRIARLQRRSLHFSKSHLIHKATILHFIHHYNQHLAPRIVEQARKRREARRSAR